MCFIYYIYIYLRMESDESESSQGSEYSSIDEMDNQSTDDKSNQKSELFLLLIDAYIYICIYTLQLQSTFEVFVVFN